MKTLKNRLAKFGRMVKTTAARALDAKTTGVLEGAVRLAGLVVLVVPAFVAIVVLGR